MSAQLYCDGDNPVVRLRRSGHGRRGRHVHGVWPTPNVRPVPGATVVIASRHADWRRSLMTDAQASFVFKEVPIGVSGAPVSLPG